MSWPWSRLGLPGPSELPEIRHAYAELLKTTHPEEDPEGFQQLHAAYQQASRLARRQKRQRTVPPPESPELDITIPAPEEEPAAQEEQSGGQDFDFERLLSQGEEERLAARRRRGAQRRGGQRESPRMPAGQEEEDPWRWAEAILDRIEVLCHAQAPLEEWKKLFAGPVFRQNRYNMDLVFELEDFLSTKNPSQEIKLALFLAYGFDKGKVRPELRPLFQMLRPAWKEDRKKNGFPWRTMLWAFVIDIVLLFSLGPILDSGLIPIVLSAAGLAFIFWVVWRVVKTGSIGRPADKRREERAAIKGILAMAAVILALSWLRSMPEDAFWKLFPAPDPREQVCRYIQEDYGVEVYSLYNEGGSYATDTYSNVFCLKEHPMRQFLAGPDGERDTRLGRGGYTTNLPEILLLWALKDFAFEREIYDVDSLDQGLEQWETGGVFLIALPKEGGEELIDGLGELVEELGREKWYKDLPAQCQVVLCIREMEEELTVLTSWYPGLEWFTPSRVRGLYEAALSAAPAP